MCSTPYDVCNTVQRRPRLKLPGLPLHPKEAGADLPEAESLAKVRPQTPSTNLCLYLLQAQPEAPTATATAASVPSRRMSLRRRRIPSHVAGRASETEGQRGDGASSTSDPKSSWDPLAALVARALSCCSH